MSQERSTLMQIFQLLKDHFEDYTNISDTQTDKFIQRRNKGVRESRNLKCNSCPTCSKFIPFIDRATSPIIFENGKEEIVSQKSCNDEGRTENVPVLLEFHPKIEKPKIEKDDALTLSFIRENAEMKIKMQEIDQHLKRLSKSIYDNEEANLDLNKIDKILSKVIRTQTRSENLCDKLCQGLEKVESSKNATANTLPSELKDVCNRIKRSVGQEYRNLGSLLGLEPDCLKRIEDDYSEADECLEPIILEWYRRQEKPSLDELVTACHTVNPDILNCKPLPEILKKVLLNHYTFFYDEMHDIAVLPHLVSSGILTLKLQRYILKPQTKDQRLSRLIDVLCTRENGLEKLITALENSDQPHVSSVLKDASQDMRQTFLYLLYPLSLVLWDTFVQHSHYILNYSKENIIYIAEGAVTDSSVNEDPMYNMKCPEEKPEPPASVSMLNNLIGRRNNSFSNELEFDDGRSCISDISYASASSNLEPQAILAQIAELLLKAGLKLSK